MISFSNFLDFACVDKKMQERKQKYTRYGVRGKKFHSFLKTSTVINVIKTLTLIFSLITFNKFSAHLNLGISSNLFAQL